MGAPPAVEEAVAAAAVVMVAAAAGTGAGAGIARSAALLADRVAEPGAGPAARDGGDATDDSAGTRVAVTAAGAALALPPYAATPLPV
jgi:hypothetical protein